MNTESYAIPKETLNTESYATERNSEHRNSCCTDILRRAFCQMVSMKICTVIDYLKPIRCSVAGQRVHIS